MDQYYQSKVMYRKNKKGIMEKTWYAVVQLRPDQPVILRRSISNPSEKLHDSVIKPSANKDARDIAITKAKHKETLALRDGWTYDIKEAEAGVFVAQPQLLHKYLKCKDRVRFPCVIQPKLDGMRCTYHPDKIKLMSRGSKEYISNKVINTLAPYDDYFDGELYIHGWKLQGITKVVKNGLDGVTFYIFDLPTRTGEIYRQRLQILKNKYPEIYEGQGCVQFVSTYICNSHEEIKEKFMEFVEAGYEGAVIKNLDAPYLWNDRSYDVLKLKGFIQNGEIVEVMTDEFKIVGVTCDPLVSGGDGIAFICQCLVSSETFKVTPKWSHSKRSEAWTLVDHSNFIGKDLTVEYRGWTKDNKPIHAVGIAVRDYE